MDGPLGREGGFEAQEGGFGGVVCGLGLRVVCAVGGDGSEEEDCAGGFLGDHLSVGGERGKVSRFFLVGGFESEEIYIIWVGLGEEGGRGEGGGGRGEIYIPSNSLRRKERPRRINIQPTIPLRRRHLNSVRTSHHPGETAQHIHASELRNGQSDRRLQLFRIRDVHFDRQHFYGREIRFQRLDLPGRFRVVEIEEREAGEAVFEQGTGVYEGEGSGAACDWMGGGVSVVGIFGRGGV